MFVQATVARAVSVCDVSIPSYCKVLSKNAECLPPLQLQRGESESESEREQLLVIPSEYRTVLYGTY